jgi:hypothetical protein
LKSDFDRVVEELTKWNNVEDITPIRGEQLLVKCSDGAILIAYYLKHRYRGEDFYSFSEPDIEFRLLNIIEWKYIY